MAIVNQVKKQIKMDIWDIVKFQIAVYCHIHSIQLSPLDLNCITLLAISGKRQLTEFCDIAIKYKIFGSSQSVRNAIVKAEKKNLILKDGKNKKKIYVNPDLKIQVKGNILLDYKVIRIETKEAERSNS